MKSLELIKETPASAAANAPVGFPSKTGITGGASLGVGVGQNMRRTVHWSRLYLLPQLLAVVGLGAALFTYRTDMPAIIWVGGELVFASAAVAYLRWMIVMKPVLTIDEAGFTYHRARLPLIRWDDLVSVERRPRVERYAGGATSTCVREEWRTIRILVRGKDENVEWNISPMGLDTDSAEIYECIRSHLPQSIGK